MVNKINKTKRSGACMQTLSASLCMQARVGSRVACCNCWSHGPCAPRPGLRAAAPLAASPPLGPTARLGRSAAAPPDNSIYFLIFFFFSTFYYLRSVQHILSIHFLISITNFSAFLLRPSLRFLHRAPPTQSSSALALKVLMV